jgi:hypothetical protein
MNMICVSKRKKTEKESFAETVPLLENLLVGGGEDKLEA